MSYFLSSSSSSDGTRTVLTSIDWLRDVPCRVEFVLGVTRLRLRDCLDLAPGSVVRLDQSAGADIELRVEGRTIASGEIVIVDNTAGLRVTRILPPPEPDGKAASHG
jgi:flagellar motor switch protein FliN/FliY